MSSCSVRSGGGLTGAGREADERPPPAGTCGVETTGGLFSSTGGGGAVACSRSASALVSESLAGASERTAGENCQNERVRSVLRQHGRSSKLLESRPLAVGRVLFLERAACASPGVGAACCAFARSGLEANTCLSVPVTAAGED